MGLYHQDVRLTGDLPKRFDVDDRLIHVFEVVSDIFLYCQLRHGPLQFRGAQIFFHHFLNGRWQKGYDQLGF